MESNVRSVDVRQAVDEVLRIVEPQLIAKRLDSVADIPPDVRVIVMPSDSRSPGGAGEAGVAAAFAAVACAYARATGTMPTEFPINYGRLSFRPKPVVPPFPQSPRNGLRHTF